MNNTTDRRDEGAAAVTAPKPYPGPYNMDWETGYIHGPGTARIAEVFGMTGPKWESAHATARVFIAAPEMLAALERAERTLNSVRTWIMQRPGCGDLPHCASWIGDDLSSARAAIAKAKEVTP